MNSSKNNAAKVADFLLQINAVKLQPSNPFKWASGWNSPIYCDNRKILAYPKIREFIKNELENYIKLIFLNNSVINSVCPCLSESPLEAAMQIGT